MKLTFDARGDVHIRLDRVILDWIGATLAGASVVVAFVGMAAHALQP